MVGYEPDLNPFVDWAKELRELLRQDEPELTDDSLSKPVIKPCLTHGVEATRDVKEMYLHFLATPLIQVFSVCVSTNFGDGKPCEIYGSISAFGGPGPCFDLYSRELEDSETLLEHGSLSLIGPEGGAMIPSLSTKLEICLKDRIHGVEVVNGTLDLDPISEDSYERLMKGEVQSAHGSAYVYYTVFQFAQYCTIQVMITKYDNGDKKCSSANIHGSIVAGYENARMYSTDDEDVKLLQTRLFEKLHHQPLHVTVGTPIKLSRAVVAVPTYSSLTIKVDLWDSNGKIAGDCLQFPAYLLGKNTKYIQTQYACVEVRARWDHAYCYLYKDRKSKASNRVESSKESRELQKKLKVLHDEHPSASAGLRPLTKTTLPYFGRYKVEVFSVFVGGITRKISTLCGTIIVDDGEIGDDKFSIYNRDETCSELLQDHSLACIEVNYRAIHNCEFRIVLNLKDPVRNLEVCRGELGWNAALLQSRISWYGKRVCSVLRGDDGYAALHYQIFSNAVEALVEVKLFGDVDPDIPINLHGILFARYSGYDYSTMYQKKYYCSRLFDRQRERSVEVKTGSKIVLLRSILAVPLTVSLIIEANLSVFGNDGAHEPIRSMAEFEIDMCGTTSKTIRGEHYWIQVDAKFQP